MSHTNVTRGSGILEPFLSKKRTEMANSLIPKNLRNGKILDIGCGSYPYFLHNTNFKEKFGIDPSLKELSVENIKLIKQDVTKNKLPFKNQSVNVVTMLAVFEHIDPQELNFVLSEIYRVLKRGGFLIVTTPSPWSDMLLHQMSKLNLISSEEIHEHKSHYDRNTIVNIIKASGFPNEKVSNGYFEIGLNMWFKAEK